MASPARSRLPSYMPLLEKENGSVNPFLNLTWGKKRSLVGRIARGIIAVSLFPIRVILTVLIILCCFVLARLATLGLCDSDFDALEGKPLAAWRQFVAWPALLLCRVQLLVFGMWHIKVKGRCASRDEAPLIVANHVSGLVEGLFFAKYAKLADAEYANTAVTGPMMKAMHAIFVDRLDPASREKSKKALFRRCVESRWPQTVVFPEGTCTNGTVLVQFKMGAFAPAAPVQPVLFRYNRGGGDDLSFTFPHSSMSYMMSLMLSLWNSMEVEYLPVYVPSDAECKSPALYAGNVQKYMADRLGVPTTKHSSEDVALCIAAKKLHLPMEAGIVQWQAISETLAGMRVKDARLIMQDFSKIDEEGNGDIDFTTFAKAMRSKVRSGSVDFSSHEKSGEIEDGQASRPAEELTTLSDEELRCIFDLLDIDGSGKLNFREYLCGVAVMNGHGPDEQEASMKLVFDSLANDRGSFSKDQLGVLLRRAVPSLSGAKLDELFAEADRDSDGLVSRQEFIDFARRHREDLGLNASRLLCGLPMATMPQPGDAARPARQT